MAKVFCSYSQMDFLQPLRLTIMACETCSAMVSKWQIVSYIRGRRDDDRLGISRGESELMGFIISPWL